MDRTLRGWGGRLTTGNTGEGQEKSLTSLVRETMSKGGGGESRENCNYVEEIREKKIITGIIFSPPG